MCILYDPFLIETMSMKRFICIIFFSLFFYGCNEKDFLSTTPPYLSDKSLYTTPEGALQGLSAAYDILQLGEQVERTEFYGSICSGDAMTGGEPGGNDGGGLNTISKFDIELNNSYVLKYWKALYRGIYICNLLLYYISDPIDNFSDQLRKRIMGEALFLRGFFHFKLQVIFGGFPQLQSTFSNKLKGVPFIDHILLYDDWYMERPELNYTWKRIEEDFIKASGLLPVRSEMYSDISNIGRATKGSAQAMLTKTYLYQEKWQQAYEIAKVVIESNEYYLEGETGHNDPYIITRLTKEGEVNVMVPGFKWIWQPEANNCMESIFDVQHCQSHSNVFPEGQEGNLIARYYAPRALLVYDFDSVTKKDVLRSYQVGWGFILPTKYFTETAFRDIDCVDLNGNILDPRFKLTVITPGDSVPFFYSDPVFRQKYPDSVKFDAYYNWPCTGNSTWKYFTDPYYDINRSNLGDYPQNTKYFRFADMLLLGAEAAINCGHQADALIWINRVRDRARNAGNTGYPLALTSVTKEQIWAERRVELAFENHQFLDIVRTGRAEKILKSDAMQYAEVETSMYTKVKEQFGDNFDPGKDEIWPYPEDQ